MKIKKFFAMLALFVGISFAGTTKLKNVEAHWLANTTRNRSATVDLLSTDQQLLKNKAHVHFRFPRK